MKPTTRKVRQEGKGRKMISSENDWGLAAITLEAKEEVGQTYAVFDLNEQADAARIEAGAKAIYFAGSLGVTWNDPDGKSWREHCLQMSKILSTAIGALSTPGKKAP
jgi:hypothetical protein